MEGFFFLIGLIKAFACRVFLFVTALPPVFAPVTAALISDSEMQALLVVRWLCSGKRHKIPNKRQDAC